MKFRWNQQQTKRVRLMVRRFLKSKTLYFNKVFQFHKIWQLLTRQIGLPFGLNLKTYSIKQVPIPIINCKAKKKKVILKYVLEIIIKIRNEISRKSFQQFQRKLIMAEINKLHRIIHLKNNINLIIVNSHQLNHLLSHFN